ncbi:flagellar assembly peptidoglycan hydrolase FlgJ [uncultured Shewanella sp.]|uniref:flagellar assembly peptidoglycan hydrolase FlgJ n=1 Tax=uncultured Shewanella sp. TaxID=173975 RepID=UPI0026285523|nr:flagellar assembly peptidoglycan hydrolase FlgJ [uncultured Shewanella sp.]
MNKLSDPSHFLDLDSFAALRLKSQKDSPEALKQVAQQFEGIFVQMLMKSMRDANKVFEADSPLNSQYTQFYEQMHDQQMSLNLSRDGMLGLSDLMVQQLAPQTSQMLPASVLRTDERTGNHGGGLTPNTSFNNQLMPADSPSARPHVQGGSINENPLSQETLNIAFAHHQPVAQRQVNPNDSAGSQGLSIKEEPSLKVRAVSTPFQALSPQTFVAKLYPYANEAANRLGTQAEVLLAQSALETGWGQKVIQTQSGNTSHNLFNIKAGHGWKGETAVVLTQEFEQGQQVKQQAPFRVYDDIKHSFDDFVDLLTQNDRYQGAVQLAQDPKAFIQGLQDAGFATDPQYTHKVMRVLKSITQDLLP